MQTQNTLKILAGHTDLVVSSNLAYNINHKIVLWRIFNRKLSGFR